ncbi:MAG: hypothetical protein HGA96_10965 [Desulfobulbaceae bacterium]|nr:hypothetical protein [Desulfobulbaceae bacterium]
MFSKKSTILGVIKSLYTPASLIFITIFAWQNYSLLENLINNANTTGICLAVMLWCIAHVLSPLLSKTILSITRPSITYTNLLQIYATRLPSRYLPGGIWHTVSRVSDLHKLGVDKKELTILVAAESMIPCLTSFTIGGGYLWLSDSGGNLNFVFGILSSASLILMFIIPKLFTKALKFDSKTLQNYFKSILVMILFWLVASCSFTSYYLSFPMNVNHLSVLEIAATYMFSWGVGFIAIFAPQGIGIFEFVAGNILKMPTTLSGTIVVLAGFRVVTLLADLTIWSACYLLSRKKN